MEKFPFNTEGAAALLQHLYSLAPAELLTEALAAEYDLTAWLIGHFELSPSQVAYLSQLDANMLHFMASNLSYALRYKLPVHLEKTKDGDEGGTKLIETKPKMTAQATNSGSLVPDGELTFTISYLPN